jgi:hypothetical protein
MFGEMSGGTANTADPSKKNVPMMPRFWAGPSRARNIAKVDGLLWKDLKSF